MAEPGINIQFTAQDSIMQCIGGLYAYYFVILTGYNQSRAVNAAQFVRCVKSENGTCIDQKPVIAFRLPDKLFSAVSIISAL